MKQRIILFFQQQWDALIASAIAVSAIYVLTRVSGIGISPDSVSYLSTAIHFRENLQWINFTGNPLVAFPLGYPFFLSAAYFVSGIHPVQIAPILNSMLYVLLILFSGWIMSGFKGAGKTYRIIFFIIIAFSPCLWEVYQMLWSETLFLLLTILFIFYWRAFQTKGTTSSFLVVATIGALAFVTRFAGVTVIATGVALLLFDGSIINSKKIRQIFLFVFIGVLPVSINLIRNRLVAGSLSGVRQVAERTLYDNLLSVGQVVSGWIPFFPGNQKWSAILFLVILFAAIGTLLYRIFQQQYYRQTETIVYGYFVFYAVFMLGISSISRFEELSSRLLSPMYVPMIWTVSSWIPATIQTAAKIKRIMLSAVALILFMICIYQYDLQNAESWDGISTAGIPGYSEQPWRKSPTVQFINANKSMFQDTIITDADDACYYLTGIRAGILPHKDPGPETDAFLALKKGTIIWFNDGENPDLVSMDFIRKQKHITDSIHLEDGSIYFFHQK